jgi:two-component SAPR family response regulator
MLKPGLSELDTVEFIALVGENQNTFLQRQQNLSSPKYSVQEIRKTYSHAYETWTKEEDERLRQAYTKGVTINNLANDFQRNPGGIRSRLKKLGLLK